ncbi:UpxY family transcription antiterminator [Pedobacter sp. ISL-68]|uniref:UpxY family transcription antiterminator n=1 Tax=unclassified Pedobacter TaxID=2628915 RepID=UPI001BEC9EFA|nr:MULTISPECIES: UpxY family transcription antiterminator [unclassified Pedobacter]MBT2562819.1 UpxY family transcription antiterminator [Pedobacter sp. ISL-64]MBT2593332.1 UpxY family transcription antiterminator [Pedobacter sp. ISL-68]
MIDQHYRWYPVYTRSRAEKKANEELNRKGIQTYLPLKKVVKQWSDRKKIVEEPLIKSYLFAYISAREYAEVLMTNGVARFIYFSSQVASIPDQQIHDLKLLLATDADLELIDYDIKPGESVLIKAGPFKGIIAELVSVHNKQRIILRLQNMGYSININTSIAFVEPL